MIIAPFNDAEMAASLIHEHRDELAGVIVEPFQRLLPPQPGFLQALRKSTAPTNGIPLIFDEVVTGFRFAYGGAQEYLRRRRRTSARWARSSAAAFRSRPIAGRADIMAQFDRAKVGDDRFLPQIGTLSGNPVAAVAGLATLEILKRPGTYEKVFATGRTLMEGLAKAVRDAGLPGQVIGEPPLFDVVFATGDLATIAPRCASTPR